MRPACRPPVGFLASTGRRGAVAPRLLRENGTGAHAAVSLVRFGGALAWFSDCWYLASPWQAFGVVGKYLAQWRHCPFGLFAPSQLSAAAGPACWGPGPRASPALWQFYCLITFLRLVVFDLSLGWGLDAHQLLREAPGAMQPAGAGAWLQTAPVYLPVPVHYHDGDLNKFKLWFRLLAVLNVDCGWFGLKSICLLRGTECASYFSSCSTSSCAFGAVGPPYAT